MPAPALPTGVLATAAPFTSDYLVQSVARRVRMPISQATLESWEILAIADEQIRSYVAPLVISALEDYLVADFDQVITAEKAVYPLPPRAMKLREIVFLDGDDVIDVPRIGPEDLDYATRGFHLTGNACVVIHPEQQAGRTLRMTYSVRPSSLVLAVEAGVVQSVDRGTGAITLCDVPAANLAASTRVDLLRGSAPFEVVAMDVPASIAGSVVTVAAGSIPADWGAPGDFVVRPQESPGVQLPPDLLPLLAQAVSVEILDQNGDDNAFQRAGAKLKELESKAVGLLSERVPGEGISWGGFNPIWDRGL